MSDAAHSLPDDIRQLIADADAPDDFKRLVAEEAVCWREAAHQDLVEGRIPRLVREAVAELITERFEHLERVGFAERYTDSAGEVRWRLTKRAPRGRRILRSRPGRPGGRK